MKILRVVLVAVCLALPSPVTSSPETPNLAEVMDVYAAMDFRNAMIDDPVDTASKARTRSARAALEAMNAAMEEWGSGPDGWRYLLGTATFAATGVGEKTTFVMFYSPWVDVALITEWEDIPESRNLIDAEWLPGDLLRGTEIHPLPVLMRDEGHPSVAMIEAMADTVDAFEAKFDTPAFAADWRRRLGLDNRDDVAAVLSPIIAVRVFQSQLRLLAITHSVEGEDPLMQPIREAVVGLVNTAVTEGFGPLLLQADRTPDGMAKTIAMIQPETMQGLFPVAYLVDDDEVLIYFASPLTTDFALAAVFDRGQTALRLRVLDFIPYAATYAAMQAAPTQDPAPTADPEPTPAPGTSRIGKTGKGIGKTPGAIKK